MTSDTIAAPRTPAPSRRRGSNLEKWGWIYMRASGVLLVVLIFGHLFINLVAGDGVRQIDFAFVAGKYATPFWQWWDVLMLWLALIHGANGMRTIVNDYVTHAGTRRVLAGGRIPHPPRHAGRLHLRPLPGSDPRQRAGRPLRGLKPAQGRRRRTRINSDVEARAYIT